MLLLLSHIFIFLVSFPMVKVIQILVLFGCVGYSSAFTLPFSKRSSAHSTSVQISSSKSQSSTASGDEQFGFTAHNDGLYTAMITVSGTQFSVCLLHCFIPIVK